MKLPAKLSTRLGAVAPLVALLLVPLLAFVAFAVDIGWITTSTAQLQAVADAAALAGTDQLMQGYVIYNTTASTTTLKTTTVAYYETLAATNAKSFAAMHGNSDIGSVTLLDDDIEFGYTDSSYNYYTGTKGQQITDGSGTSQFPNTITVTLYRGTNTTGNTPNAQLTLFFGSIFGYSQAPVNVRARAIILNGQLTSLPQGGAMLPLTLDFNAWNKFIYDNSTDDSTTTDDERIANSRLSKPFTRYNNGGQLQSPYTVTDEQYRDGFNITIQGTQIQNSGYGTYPISTATFTSGTSGFYGDPNMPNLQAYPSDSLTSGSFGWLSMNNSDASAAAKQNWIENGLSASDIQALISSFSFTDDGTSYTDTLYPIKQSDNPGGSIRDSYLNSWQGDTGFESSTVQALADNVGSFAFLPLFAPADGRVSSSNNNYVASKKDPGPWTGDKQDEGRGINSYYNVVDYVGVQVTKVTTGGSSTAAVYVQPAAFIPPSATFFNPGGSPAGSSGFSYAFLPSKLIQP
jgi:Flp pilus assembly protein TadG